MKKWVVKEKENIADVFLEIYGKNEQSLFENITEAFCDLITCWKKIKEEEKFLLILESKNLEDLVFNFIEKLIYFKDVQGLIFKKGVFIFKKKEKSTLFLRAYLKGEKIKKNTLIKTDIKSITYHKFAILRDKTGYKVHIVFDL